MEFVRVQKVRSSIKKDSVINVKWKDVANVQRIQTKFVTSALIQWPS